MCRENRILRLQTQSRGHLILGSRGHHRAVKAQRRAAALIVPTPFLVEWRRPPRGVLPRDRGQHAADERAPRPAEGHHGRVRGAAATGLGGRARCGEEVSARVL
eukprot:gene14847-biopygen10914